MSVKTKVAVTAEESAPGVPVWGPNSNATEVPQGQTDIAIENLVAGRRYYVKTWNEDQWGNRSNELVRTIQTEIPTRVVPMTFSANGFFDSGSAMSCYFKVPTSAKSIQQVIVTLAFREFQSTAASASSGGSSVPTSSPSSASSAGNTTVGVSLSPGTGSVVSGVSGAASAGTVHTHTVGTYRTQADDSAIIALTDHAHTIAHTHDVTVPAHTHALVYGTFEETYPVSHNVAMRIYHREGSGWVLRQTISGFTYDLQDADLTAYFDAVGDWKITLLSAGGTPQGGRIGCDIFGTVTVVI